MRSGLEKREEEKERSRPRRPICDRSRASFLRRKSKLAADFYALLLSIL
jgi:hypothetical protein